MKKAMATFLIVLIMIMGISTTIFAAPADDIMAALEATDAPDVYFPQIEAYLNSITITQEQADAVISHIEKADEIAAGESKWTKMDKTTQHYPILDEIYAAAEILKLRVTYHTPDYVSPHVFTVYDVNGVMIFQLTDDELIKQTGYDYSIILIGAALILMAGVIAIFARRQKAVRTNA